MNWRVFSGFAAVAVMVAACVIWATDFVTLQGEWTIYTADCKDGAWNGSTCSGRLVAAERYRFRALRIHREVLFWTVGDNTSPSGRYENCDVTDGRTWTCPASPDMARTVTRKMTMGVPTDDATGGVLHVHRIPKWKWEALKQGLSVGGSAFD